ncbi:SDR family oxidoreductase [Photobacterium alginatilyticum]|uniref:SDR family oxidoreductase n=1 Tax=Photobacterium alginatilyticum TaxID=1775171 RepID=A0ABW9YBQ3_9GAMM|nr:SDR family oxidoreductase [Photobacterium alginatilyticum]NBI51207.1 SDR family oxidoreductase [Photobacterium alginatilyticum]
MTFDAQPKENKVVFITGANSGMGLETAILFARNNYQVYGSVRSLEKAAELKVVFEQHDLPITPVVCDVTKTQDVEDAINFIIQHAGTLDILVNNAGYGLVASVEEGTDEEFIQQFDVNVFGILRTCRAVIPFMREQKSGIIVNVSSFLGKMGLPLLTHYNSSKYAVEGITDSLRYELAPFGIKVHTVAPGLFKTGFVKNGLQANSVTTSQESPYASQANTLLPQVVDKINNGPSPASVAKSVLSIVEGQELKARVPAGEDSVYFDKLSRELCQEDFELAVSKALSL